MLTKITLYTIYRNYGSLKRGIGYQDCSGGLKRKEIHLSRCVGRVNRISLPSEGFVNFTGRKVFSNLGKRGYYYGKGIPATENCDLIECY